MYAMKKRYPKFLKLTGALLLILAFIMAGCSNQVSNNNGDTISSEQPAPAEKSSITDDNKKITIIHSLPSETLDPHNGWIALRAGVTETLVRLDENMHVTPWLASKWEAKDDVTWVFTIRDDIDFQDGTKLDAAAAKASFERGITDSKALAASLKIASLEANGQELTIKTTEPLPAYPTELVHPTTSLISVAAETSMGKEKFNQAPVGTGPFKVTSFVSGKEIKLVRNDAYWDEKARLAEVTFQSNADANIRTLAFQSKQADIVYHLSPESLEAIKQEQDLSVESVTSLRTHYFTYNPASNNVTDIQVRQAIDKLIDRDAIVNDIMLGHAMPANGPFNSTLPFGNSEAAQKLDSVGALQLLESAGYTAGANGKLEKDGKALTLKLIAFSGINPELPLIPLVVQSEAAKIGVTIEIVSVEYPEVYIKDQTDWDISTSSYLTSPRGDGGSFLNSTYIVGGSYNPANIHIDKLDPIIKQLNATGEVAQRNELTRKAVEIINEAMPHSYIINPNILVGVNKRVANWKPGAEEFYIVTNKLDVN
ncbi:nickel ABC transporter substrate-binding protein [Paenibacillus luteus]|uniref:nickel ABC transporter substrate-binding protein n=1 Tax=Paenibacillus luteus TaxID=2545753 RepID=UPI0011448A03|nr:nickel ABC transporter substrate-binding protein [Paenibacillus luteus]